MSKDRYSLPQMEPGVAPTIIRQPTLDEGIVLGFTPKEAPLGASGGMTHIRFEFKALNLDSGLTQRRAAVGDRVVGLHEHFWVSGGALSSRLYMARNSGQDLQIDQSSDGTTWSAFATVANKGTLKYVPMVSTQNVLFVCISEEDELYQSNSGAALTLVSASDVAPKFMVPFAERLIGLWHEGDPQVVTWSANGNVLNFSSATPGTGQVSIIDSKSHPIDELRGAGTIGSDILALFRQRSIVKAFRTGNIDLAIGFRDWVDGVGTEFPGSLTTVPNGLAFLGHDFMPYYLTESGIQAIGENVAQHIKRHVEDPGVESRVQGLYDPILQMWWLGINEDGADAITRVLRFYFGEFFTTGRKVWDMRSEYVHRFSSSSIVLV